MKRIAMENNLKYLLKKNFEIAVQAYVNEFCKITGMQFGFWIDDEVGGLADFDEYYTLSFLEIKTCVDENVSRETLVDWYEYCVDSLSSNPEKTIPNLKSWLIGWSPE